MKGSAGSCLCPPGLTCRRAIPSLLLISTLAGLHGCDGPQSALAPAGVEAGQIANLFWVMTIAGGLIWVAVMVLVVYATRPRQRARFHPRSTRWLIVGAGAVFPTLVLGALLSYGLKLLPALRDPGDVALHITVSGEQWWWRVRYQLDNDESVELANEIRLPVGKKVEFELESSDVIHSFWVPSLGGKVDMTPGRRTRLVLQPTKTGTFRGACAEYCGASHAYMMFDVVVTTEQEFRTWLDRQQEPASEPSSEIARRGQILFVANGCGACHQVRGTRARGRIGPDLTHVGSRLRVGAGMMPSTPESFERWISETEHIKPGVKMPSFGMLPEDQITAIAHYLSELQ
ncbi:cytochrome c oxidase subunit II [Gilvimarinus sp. F26214L]|uniref:cytochrome c oxidase subunit II n=1 Tax=Gilvimarinus sp. DZF01 TaxID=3461371 RepID=UPI0040453AFB